MNAISELEAGRSEADQGQLIELANLLYDLLTALTSEGFDEVCGVNADITYIDAESEAVVVKD